MSEHVILCLMLPGAVAITWFVAGVPDPGKVGGSHPVLLEPALSGKKSLRWRAGSAKAGAASVEHRLGPVHIAGFLVITAFRVMLP